MLFISVETQFIFNSILICKTVHCQNGSLCSLVKFKGLLFQRVGNPTMIIWLEMWMWVWLYGCFCNLQMCAEILAYSPVLLRASTRSERESTTEKTRTIKWSKACNCNHFVLPPPIFSYSQCSFLILYFKTWVLCCIFSCLFPHYNRKPAVECVLRKCT